MSLDRLVLVFSMFCAACSLLAACLAVRELGKVRRTAAELEEIARGLR